MRMSVLLKDRSIASLPDALFVQASVAGLVAETAASRTFLLDVDHPRFAHARPGQHVTVAVEIDGVEHIRSYSLSSVAAFGEKPSITIKRQRDGLVSNWLLDHVAIGSVLKLSPPVGTFLLAPGATPVTFFAAGSGFTPIFAMVRYALAVEQRRATLLYVNKDGRQTIFAAELRRLQARFGDLITFLEWHTQSAGALPEDILLAAIDGNPGARFHLCGPDGFMRACQSVLDRRAVPWCRIRKESFGGSHVTTAEIARPFTARMRRADGGHDLLQASAGSSLLDAIKTTPAGPGRMGACGGQGACGTCRVTFDPLWFDRLVPATRRERRLLDALPKPDARHRLACQIRFDANLDGIAFAPAPIM